MCVHCALTANDEHQILFIGPCCLGSQRGCGVRTTLSQDEAPPCKSLAVGTQVHCSTGEILVCPCARRDGGRAARELSVSAHCVAFENAFREPLSEDSPDSCWERRMHASRQSFDRGCQQPLNGTCRQPSDILSQNSMKAFKCKPFCQFINHYFPFHSESFSVISSSARSHFGLPPQNFS